MIRARMRGWSCLFGRGSQTSTTIPLRGSRKACRGFLVTCRRTTSDASGKSAGLDRLIGTVYPAEQVHRGGTGAGRAGQLKAQLRPVPTTRRSQSSQSSQFASQRSFSDASQLSQSSRQSSAAMPDRLAETKKWYGDGYQTGVECFGSGRSVWRRCGRAALSVHR